MGNSKNQNKKKRVNNNSTGQKNSGATTSANPNYKKSNDYNKYPNPPCPKGHGDLFIYRQGRNN